LPAPTESKYKVQVREVIIDLGMPTPEAFEELKAVAKELEITVLGQSQLMVDSAEPVAAKTDRERALLSLMARAVNSAGLSHDIPVYFAETETDEMLGIIDIVRPALGLALLFSPLLRCLTSCVRPPVERQGNRPDDASHPSDDAGPVRRLCLLRTSSQPR
jgi:hypothetical protein